MLGNPEPAEDRVDAEGARPQQATSGVALHSHTTAQKDKAVAAKEECEGATGGKKRAEVKPRKQRSRKIQNQVLVRQYLKIIVGNQAVSKRSYCCGR